ncbi:hypothetical protein B0A49_02640 [Cryomyces minteri]|uniref:RNA polymerase II elongation factor ELL N-terminal domain-containing protein n=1 Tax=Cryomyces minteri TaxID=331657 RepID=A0A4U0XH82_9PEZI|nr:hypothetical protein B0A49_02640 [Cryomyces minteri]
MEGTKKAYAMMFKPPTRKKAVEGPSVIALAIEARNLESLQRQKEAKLAAGPYPALMINSTRRIELKTTAEPFTHELYRQGGSEQSKEMSFVGLISCKASEKSVEKQSEADTAGQAGANTEESDAALETLKNTMATLHQEKESRKATIVKSYLPPSEMRKSNKLQPFKKNTSVFSNNTTRSLPTSPSLGAPSTNGIPPTSAPSKTLNPKSQALRIPLVHLLAVKPAGEIFLADKLRAKREDVRSVLQKVAKKAPSESEWRLADKAYKELDLWKFPYPPECREAAIDNAVRAYDRLRLSRADNLWQLLLPKEERGKGKVLSRLNLQTGSFNRVATPRMHLDSSTTGQTSKEKTSEALAAPSMERTKSNDSINTKKVSEREAMSKKMFAKDPIKAMIKKKPVKEAAKSKESEVKPAKKTQGRKAEVKAKSAEFVHDSDEDEKEEDIISTVPERRAAASGEGAKSAKASAKTTNDEGLHQTLGNMTGGGVARPKANATTTKLAGQKLLSTDEKGGKAQTPAALATSREQQSTPSATPKQTPTHSRNKSLHTVPDSRLKSELSPSKPNTRPQVPSPLGAARPMNSSDSKSDGPAKGTEKNVKTSSASKSDSLTKDAAGGARQPGGKAIAANPVNGIKRRRASESDDEEAMSPRKVAKLVAYPSSTPVHAAETNYTAGRASSVSNNSDDSLKRKANDLSSDLHNHGAPSKTRKLSHGGSSSQSLQSQSDTLPDESDTSNGSPPLQLSLRQAAEIARKYKEYYPKYEAAYRRLEAMHAAGEEISQVEKDKVLRWHDRLSQMRKEFESVPAPGSA